MARVSRYFLITLAGAQAVYWLYTFRLILMNMNPLGDGFEWVAVVPFGIVFLAFVAPSLWLGAAGRRLPLGLALAVAGLVLNGLLFIEIASELTNDGARPLKF
jgi:hypothetical protein